MSNFWKIHIEQAELNEKSAINALNCVDKDWAVTMCFYAALHYVKAYAHFKHHNIKSKYKHKIDKQHDYILYYVSDESYGTEESYEKRGDKGETFIAYERLFNASMTSRYLQNISTNAQKYFKDKDITVYFEKVNIVKKFFSIKPVENTNPATQRPHK